MNIKYHVAVGVIGEIYFDSHGLFLLGSLLPDFALIPNEINLVWQRQNFDPNKVPRFILDTYHFTHSLVFAAIVFYFNPIIGYGVILHQLCDWFTHTGVFSTRPLYPFMNWSIPFGREILK